MFREGRKLKGGRLERMIAKAMEVIYQDEKNHYRRGGQRSGTGRHEPAGLTTDEKGDSRNQPAAGLYAQRNVSTTADQPRN